MMNRQFMAALIIVRTPLKKLGNRRFRVVTRKVSHFTQGAFMGISPPRGPRKTSAVNF